MSDDVLAVSTLPAVTPDTTVRYDALVKELAFLCWIEADGNVERAHALMLKRCQQADPDEDYPLPSELPTVRTLYRWQDREHWRDKLALAVAEQWPTIRARQTARLVMMADRAMDVMAQAHAHPDKHDPHSVSLVSMSAASKILDLAGLGTAGAKGGEPTISAPAHPIDDDDPTISHTDRQRRLLDRSRGRT